MSEKSTLFNRKTQQTFGPYTPEPHQRKPSQQRKNQVCIEHSQPVEYLCFSCSSFPLCAQCIGSAHHQHDLKNLERSRQLLKSQLQEWNIRLESKCEILGVINDQLRNSRAEIYEQAERYKQKVIAEFRELSNKIEEQLHLVLKSISDFSSDCKKNFTQKSNQIVLKQIQIKNMIQQNNQKMLSNSLWMQAQHYNSKTKAIDLLLQEEEIAYFKHFIVVPLWGIDPLHFKDVVHALCKLKVNFKMNAFAEKKAEEEKVRESFVKSVKKSKKQLKLNELDELQRRDIKARNSNNNSISPFLATFTPKNQSKQKKFPGKRSPEKTLLKKKKKSTCKMVSLPASPAKEPQREAHVEPSPSTKSVFKKK